MTDELTFLCLNIWLSLSDPNRFRFTRQTTFGRRHMTHCTDSSITLWIVSFFVCIAYFFIDLVISLLETDCEMVQKCFFRQFFNSVAKVDYLTLRHGFIAVMTNPDFDLPGFMTFFLKNW